MPVATAVPCMSVNKPTLSSTLPVTIPQHTPPCALTPPKATVFCQLRPSFVCASLVSAHHRHQRPLRAHCRRVEPWRTPDPSHSPLASFARGRKGAPASVPSTSFTRAPFPTASSSTLSRRPSGRPCRQHAIASSSVASNGDAFQCLLCTVCPAVFFSECACPANATRTRRVSCAFRRPFPIMCRRSGLHGPPKRT